MVGAAIWKRPLDGRVFAGRPKLAADGQADVVGHGGGQRAVTDRIVLIMVRLFRAI